MERNFPQIMVTILRLAIKKKKKGIKTKDSGSQQKKERTKK